MITQVLIPKQKKHFCCIQLLALRGQLLIWLSVNQAATMGAASTDSRSADGLLRHHVSRSFDVLACTVIKRRTVDVWPLGDFLIMLCCLCGHNMGIHFEGQKCQIWWRISAVFQCSIHFFSRHKPLLGQLLNTYIRLRNDHNTFSFSKTRKKKIISRIVLEWKCWCFISFQWGKWIWSGSSYSPVRRTTNLLSQGSAVAYIEILTLSQVTVQYSQIGLPRETKCRHLVASSCSDVLPSCGINRRLYTGMGAVTPAWWFRIESRNRSIFCIWCRIGDQL